MELLGNLGAAGRLATAALLSEEWLRNLIRLDGAWPPAISADQAAVTGLKSEHRKDSSRTCSRCGL